MNITKIYQESINQYIDGGKPIKSLDADKQLAREKWLEHPMTKEFFSKLDEELKRSNDSAILLSLEGDDNDRKVNNLNIQTATLRKVINYGRREQYIATE